MSEINNLPTSSSLKELIDRQELLTNAIEVQKNNLKSILQSKNVEVSEGENKLSTLISKVSELGEYGDGKLWLYKDGDECIDVTGGFEYTVKSYGNADAKSQKLSDRISTTVSYSNGAYAYDAKWQSKKMFDVTEYNKLCVEADSVGTSQYVYFVPGLSQDDTPGNQTAYISYSNIHSVPKQVKSVDISNLKGMHNFKMLISLSVISSPCTNNIYKIWLEK